MQKFTEIITHYHKSVVLVFMALTILSAVMIPFVTVNYNINDYLPEDSPSMVAVDVLEEEFGSPMQNARVMIEDVSVQEALTYKDRLEAIEGVSDVTWLDDVVDLRTPLELVDEGMLETYYQDRYAIIEMTIQEGEELAITDEIYELIGEENALVGDAIDTAVSQQMAFTETLFAALLLVPIIIIILILSTTSWVEPLFFLTAIGVSVLINLGTNIFIGEVSFVTNSVAPILQLAVALDYAIFLLHSFSDQRKTDSNPVTAMQKAVRQSFPAIAASAATTFFGFMALAVMEFEIGADLGLNLVKGIALSFISVVVFLPALTVWLFKWIDKTQHKPMFPQFRNVGKRVVKVRYFSIVLVALIIFPAYLAQQETSFIYGIGEQPEDTRLGADEVKVNEVFGQSTPIVLLVPRGDVPRELSLEQDLLAIPEVDSIMSYNELIGSMIPQEHLDESMTEAFLSENYSQLILYTETESEGDEAFAVVEEVKSYAGAYYGDGFHALGESVSLYDIKDIVLDDNRAVNIMTVIAIGAVIMVTFRSLLLPVILLVTIQSSVWINLAVPYVTDTPLVYIGYLVVGTVQLAATVDYAILFTENFMENRKRMPARAAIIDTVNNKTFSISISAAILSSVGFILFLTSTNPIIGSIGLLIGRGALLAFLMVLFLLPAILLVGDRLVEKLTYKTDFYKERD
ncbi:exporter of the RND superfamily protein-like protein [[Bacillus] selenitireducens MLS10]|uniref:Exporter of the RND superfamily protein-like protein n=1 Tax=Bacillus selenitireducens (strain ATCC 700615 / DSM 15326 / MLS10) TaxID=439292 RepID=D6XX77_BACIE|nr:exporter of the RND superfamily protein-like protein [[Bacillus] selenitireducens MLS10]